MNNRALTLNKDVYIHPTAIVLSPELLGQGTKVWAYATIFEGVATGDNCSVGSHSYIGRNAILGSDVRLGDFVYIVNNMQIGNRVFISSHVVFCNDRYPIVNNHSYLREDPMVEDDVSIGANATILPGVVLSKGCMIGAGSVVTHNIQEDEVVAGNPAKRTKQ